MRGWRSPAWVPVVVFALTVVQLAAAVFVFPDLERFEDKAFGARLVANPLMMLALPALWWWWQRRAGRDDEVPYGAFALVMASFLIDVTGNSLDLYDSVGWWDNASHFLTWVPLCAGIGLVLAPSIRPRWAIVAVVTGLGAILAVLWEIGEWYSFIRRGTELEGAYEDTLSDLLLGLLGGLAAAVWVARVSARAPSEERKSSAAR